jgi:protein-S-isoprenylcysteine O-methyltransferase Ste14
MPGPDALETRRTEKSLLDRALSLFTDVRAGEGATALLMLINIFVLLICYSVIKTVREPLILLGGGAEVRSYAAAGQALLLGRVSLLWYALGVAAAMVAFVRWYEEPRLRATFGAEYDTYRRNVPGWLPKWRAWRGPA